MKENEYKAQIKLINHLLLALCDCELTLQGRKFLIKLRDKLKNRIDDTGSTEG
jgi:hypothetical protein